MIFFKFWDHLKILIKVNLKVKLFYDAFVV